MKKKILALSHTSDFTGGAEAVLLSLIKGSTDRYEWTVVVPSKSGSFYEKLLGLSDVKIKVIFTPWWCSGSSYGQRISGRTLRRNLSKLKHLAHGADILLSNSITNPWLAYTANVLSKKHIWYIHEFGDIDHGLDFSLGYAQSLRFVNDSSDKIMTVSSAVKDHISNEIDTEKIKIVAQSVDIDSLIKLKPRTLNLTDLNVLVLGSIKPSKGQDVLINAVKKINTEDQAKLSIRISGPVVDEDYTDRLEKSILKLSIKHGLLKRGFVEPLQEYDWADIVVVPSLNEALGRTTLEALASGRIVLGADSGATSELLKDGLGVLFKSGSAADLKNKLVDLMSGNINLKSSASRVKSVSVRFNKATEAQQFEDVVSSVLNNKVRHESTYTDLISNLKLGGFIENGLKNFLRRVFRSLRKFFKG